MRIIIIIIIIIINNDNANDIITITITITITIIRIIITSYEWVCIPLSTDRWEDMATVKYQLLHVNNTCITVYRSVSYY